MQRKLIRITTIPVSLSKLLGGQLKFMNNFYKVIGVSSDADYLQKVGVQENIDVKHIEMTRQITPVKDLKSVISLYRFFKKEKPFIVHTHTPKAGVVGMIAAKLAGVPHRLHTVAGLPLLVATGGKRKMLNVVEKVTYASATKVYPNSFGLKEIILENKFCSPSKVKVLGNGSSNGINTSHFSAEHFSEKTNVALKQKIGIEHDDFVFVFVGRLVADKGINELVKAFREILETNVKLILVGPFEKELDPLYSDTLKEIENNERIIAVGLQSDVRPYFAISNALVFPSYREGFPNVVMQAGAMGLPSIVTDINGCNEIIKDSENGLIIPAKNADAVLNSMRVMIENVELYQRMKHKARHRIVEQYEQETVWKAILEEYKSLEIEI